MINLGKITELTLWNTGKCNLRCKYCFVYSLYKNQPNKDMTKDVADRVIEFSRDHLMMPNGSIWFFGAEPFMNFNIMKYIVEKCVANGLQIKFGVTTNLTLLTPEIVKWMSEYEFGILCSIDLSPEKHNANRIYPNGKGSWDQAFRGLQLVRKYLNPNPQIRATFSPSTVEGLSEDIRSFVEDHGLYALATDAVYEAIWTDDDLKKLEKEFIILKDYYRKWYNQGLPITSMFVRDGIGDYTLHKRNWMSRCGISTGSVGVDINGDLYPCHRFVASRSLKIGDIYNGFSTDRLEYFKNWRLYPPYSVDPENCLQCTFKKSCMGGCIAVNWDLFRDVHIVPRSVCDIKRLCVKHFSDLYLEFQNNDAFRQAFSLQLRE